MFSFPDFRILPFLPHPPHRKPIHRRLERLIQRRRHIRKPRRLGIRDRRTPRPAQRMMKPQSQPIRPPPNHKINGGGVMSDK